MKLPNDIRMEDYDYNLPAERIALYPSDRRDASKLLVRHADGRLTSDLFSGLPLHIKKGSCMVFNDSRVIPVRLLFSSGTGKIIELLCLKPVEPHGFAAALRAESSCVWECLAGNLRSWKSGPLRLPFQAGGTSGSLLAEKAARNGNPLPIRFSWDDPSLSFGRVLDLTGKTPLPPYIRREAEEGDCRRYQTIYARYDGSVAAPTAGLHFSPSVLSRLEGSNIPGLHVTLHVGAGTFLPVKTAVAADHVMHSETFAVRRATVESLLAYGRPVVAVGTTSVRTLESLYWLGVKLQQDGDRASAELGLGQWEPWQLPQDIPLEQSLQAVLCWLSRHEAMELLAETRLMIVPGYRFRTVDTLITNFHQPKSSLLLLIAAFLGNSWKDVYRYALEHDFRFLSYGDSSLLFRDAAS